MKQVLKKIGIIPLTIVLAPIAFLVVGEIILVTGIPIPTGDGRSSTAPAPPARHPTGVSSNVIAGGRAMVALMETNGVVRLDARDALHNVAWMNGAAWREMSGPMKQNVAASLAIECDAREGDDFSEVEILDAHTAVLLATWKYSWGAPVFKAY